MKYDNLKKIIFSEIDELPFERAIFFRYCKNGIDYKIFAWRTKKLLDEWFVV